MCMKVSGRVSFVIHYSCKIARNLGSSEENSECVAMTTAAAAGTADAESTCHREVAAT